MRYDLEQKLNKQFPWFKQAMEWKYDDVDNPVPNCECGDGWFDLLFKMLVEIDDLYFDNCLEVDLEVQQIKEKYGTLRAYFGNYLEGLYEITSKYEDISEKTCETCGKDGKMDTVGWHMVKCEECFAEQKAIYHK